MCGSTHFVCTKILMHITEITLSRAEFLTLHFNTIVTHPTFHNIKCHENILLTKSAGHFIFVWRKSFDLSTFCGLFISFANICVKVILCMHIVYSTDVPRSSCLDFASCVCCLESYINLLLVATRS